MFLTIEELYAFKAQYEEQIKELARKQAVVDELIAYATSKESENVEETEISVEEVESVVETEDTELETV